MALTLEITGEAVADTDNLTSLILDDKNMLGMDHQVLTKVITQVVIAINTLSKQVKKCKEDDEMLQESVQHLEQQMASFEVRSRECEDTCQEINLQLGTMVDQAEKRMPERQQSEAEAEVVTSVSEVSQKDLNEVAQKFEMVMKEVEAVKRSQQEKADAQRAKHKELEAELSRHQDYMDDDIENRLVQLEEDKSNMKADLDSIRTLADDNSSRKANKVDMDQLTLQVRALEEGQTSNNKMLTEATEHFSELSGLTDLVNENQNRMQDMWAQFGKESQELREWASNGFVELRAGVRSKMSELEGLQRISEIQKEVRELSPYLAQAITRMEAHVRLKSDVVEVQRLQDDLEALNRATGRPKQLLVGTKCLACDRQVTTADTTDQGSVNLNDTRQQGELWHEVQRALDKRPDKDGAKDVLKYVAIHVGNPTKARTLTGGFFDGRDSKDASPGGHYLMRVGGGGGSLGRPVTVDSATRSPPRDPPPIVRVAPRRPVPLATRAGAVPAVPSTPRGSAPGSARMPNSSVRAALGPLPSTGPTPHSMLASSAGMSDYSPPMQPGAHSGMIQSSATELDSYAYGSEPYIIDGGRSPSPF